MLANLILKSYKALRALLRRSVIIECDLIPHKFDNVPLKKIFNWILVEASILRKPERPWGWPTHLMIEPTTYCNLKCALCPVTEGMERPRGHMDFGLFKRVIDEVGDYAFLLFLWDWGEPFLNPSIYQMISYAKQKGIKVISSTNGHLFAQAEHADKVIQSGLDTLIVAVDGISQETYERYRGGGNLESVLQGIREIVARKRTLKSATPLINFRFIVMRHNEHEIPQLKDLAKSLEVDALTLKTLNPYSNDTYYLKRSAKDKRGNEFLPKDSRYRRFSYSPNGQTPLRVQNNPCKNLWNNPVVHWNGIVCPCTYDYNEQLVFGDLKTNTFKDIWFGVSYRDIRRRFRSGWESINICRDCSLAFEGGNCPFEGIAETFFFDPKAGV